MNTTLSTNCWKLAETRKNQEENPYHHLWSNRGAWWMHITITDGLTTRRFRFSLKTRDDSTAIRRRTKILNSLQGKTFSL